MLIQTVLGPIQPDAVTGPVLPHEHLALDLRTEADAGGMLSGRHAAAVAAELADARERADLSLVIDQTCRGMGRDPDTLQTIAADSGVPVVASTGWYYQRFHPEGEPGPDLDAATELLLTDLRVGIDGTDVCAGLIGEIGTHGPAPTSAERTSLRAAGRASARTGAPIATHAHLGIGALGQLDVLADSGADLARVCVGHQDLIDDVDQHARIADAGAYLAFDTVGKESYQGDDVRVRMLLALLEQGLGAHLLLSNDISRHSYLRSEGGQGYAHVLCPFADRLRAAGVDGATLTMLYRDNALRWLTGSEDIGPAAALRIGVRS
ncbi:phosphotriesterase [Ruania zhangjianzhongii]|uniref:phosphotriesterase family protein n=1 Tax=Ruania zhangjianzhongii TaxID=2603206 RepID=UPI0011C96B41|nr:phosphotriesterase [Ruania zhangjianzhongii]